MTNKNRYYEGYNGSDNRIEFLKYGLSNEFGYNLNYNQKEQYNENKIVKTTHEQKKAFK